MSGLAALGVAATFTWLGMVLAISFLEAPLKFRAPDVTLRIGLGIGRLVFRALNVAEAAFAVLVLVAAGFGGLPVPAVALLVAAAILLVAQLALVRPRLTRRSNAVLAGADVPRSHAHYAYVALESAKVIALLVGGALTLAG
ncbi:hypothetical protein [Actinocatenispora sera]|uniref:Transmembrane protein n=1 Tax=Actinocatenispora sera TaxID=390989 RepID=A0A810L9V0_9ACTN|nr:hypothetical protein [Actinocatenispora sera]BCJ32340.1 hypothetical protein Asera_64480 [Actinocatenispora sera]